MRVGYLKYADQASVRFEDLIISCITWRTVDWDMLVAPRWTRVTRYLKRKVGRI